jgi:hypothetical protein
VYQFRNNEQNEIENWDVYESHGCQLRLVDAMPLDRFNISDGTPIHIKSLANGTLYSDMAALVVKDKAAKQICGPDVSWDMFIQSQPVWVGTLLQDVHFFSDAGYSNLWEIVHELEGHGYLLAVSDGSVKFHDMSFKWILATPTGKRLAAAAGPCNGRGNSLQAEGAGMLSVTMFIALIRRQACTRSFRYYIEIYNWDGQTVLSGQA